MVESSSFTVAGRTVCGADHAGVGVLAGGANLTGVTIVLALGGGVGAGLNCTLRVGYKRLLYVEKGQFCFACA